MMKDYVDSLKTVSGKAKAIAVNEILFDDYTEIFKDLARYDKVTKEQLREVAKKYLKTKQRSLIKIIPQKNKQADNHQSSKAGV